MHRLVLHVAQVQLGLCSWYPACSFQLSSVLLTSDNTPLEFLSVQCVYLRFLALSWGGCVLAVFLFFFMWIFTHTPQLMLSDGLGARNREKERLCLYTRSQSSVAPGPSTENPLRCQGGENETKRASQASKKVQILTFSLTGKH